MAMASSVLEHSLFPARSSITILLLMERLGLFKGGSHAGGRLFGTLLSGLGYQWAGLAACLWTCTGCALIAVICTAALPRNTTIA